jgi:hypothetical protein
MPRLPDLTVPQQIDRARVLLDRRRAQLRQHAAGALVLTPSDVREFTAQIADATARLHSLRLARGVQELQA